MNGQGQAGATWTGANAIGHNAMSLWAEAAIRTADGDRTGPRFKDRILGVGGDGAAIYLDTTRALIKRRVAGLPQDVLPLSTFAGVAARFDAEAEIVRLELVHPDPSMTVPLDSVVDLDRAARLWQQWSKVLELPMMIFEADGTLVPAPLDDRTRLPRPPASRRFGRATTRRRPTIGWKRGKAVIRRAEAPVHRGEREIIART